jgi:hypothetical protein
MTSKTASDNPEEEHASDCVPGKCSDSDSDDVQYDDDVPYTYYTGEDLEPQHPWDKYCEYRKHIKKNDSAAAAGGGDDDFDYGSDGDAEVMLLSDQLRFAKKRPELAQSERVNIKRLKKAYNAVESQAWIGGTLEEISEVVVDFLHLEQCV